MYKTIIFLYLLLSFLITSCGADKLATKTNTLQNSALMKKSCECDSSYSPVCGSDGKNYDNSCIASCFEATVAKKGHCVCSNTAVVCGSDGQDYTECDAEKNLSIQIVKYVPCNKVEQ